MFYFPGHRFVFIADETMTLPIWDDTSPGNAARNLSKVLAMADAAPEGQAPLALPVDSDNEEGPRAPGLFPPSRRRDPHMD